MTATRMKLLALGLASVALAVHQSHGADFLHDIRPVLEKHCFHCHGDEPTPKGGINLERFQSDSDVMADRGIWRGVFDKVETHQMPPPKRESQPNTAERSMVLAWIANLAARPDPALGVRDPGKPVLRRLTRLEYNNTVRDLLGLDTDVFLFPERQPLKGKDYFQPASGQMGEKVNVQLIEFGGKMPALLPGAGLPGDNRAEHGFRNRGDAMNLSPLLLEQYVALAGSIVSHPDLPQRSRVFAELLGVDFTTQTVSGNTKAAAQKGDVECVAAGVFAPNASALRRADGSADNVESRFREEVAGAFHEGRGGVFDGADALPGAPVLPGKGALLRVRFGNAGAKALTVNPNEDLWLAAFATADATSGKKLFCNQTKGAKRFELTFKIENGDPDEAIARLAVCVLGRKRESGEVSLTARFSDDTETKLTASIAEGPLGTTFFSFAAVPGEHVKSLIIDGSKFSGGYVLIDDLGFITTGRARPITTPPPAVTHAPSPPTKAAPAKNPADKTVRTTLPPADRLAALIDRAFRRTATAEERTRFQTLFDAERNSGKSEADAMRVAVQAVLSSPGFLFLAEPSLSKGGKVRVLDDFELASRLSYFLWASAPDEELLTVARAGKLHDDTVLEAQTRRMLRDPRARELSESFATQWLRLDQLYTSKPDAQLFKTFYSGPQGKNTLHGPMLLEALLLFETVLVEDRSILDFVDANYTWLNPRLAKLYGIDLNAAATDTAAGVAGQPNRELKSNDKDPSNVWRRVPLADKSRGGFLTMAAPLTITSLPFRTSPVKRGAWLLETLFNRPPSEPKVAFAVENDTKEAAQAMSIRQRFEAHRNKAACYSCHIRLDPPGFALEPFDAIGAWRDTDGGTPVDAHSEWNGHPFDGPAGYKAALMKNPGEFTRGFIEHLLSYALGRELAIYDMPAVHAIQEATSQDGYRLGRIILEIVKAYPFRNVRETGAPKPGARD